MSSGYSLQPNEKEFFLASSEGIELSCILTTAISKVDVERLGKSYPFDKDLKLKGLPHPQTKRSVILMHGIGGHKNYTYHSKLARKLAHEQGVTSVRFDFRNCGSSTKTGKAGRTVQDDIEDCETVYKFLKEKTYSVDAVIGHSRGVVDLFNWQLKNKDIFVPNLVACAGRFIGSGLPTSIKKSNPDFQANGGHFIKGFQDGTYKDVWVPLKETQSLGELYMSGVKTITKYSDTLLVYGLEEEIIPLTDSAHYANCLGDRNTLVFVPNASHSYYGINAIPEEQWKDSDIPINTKKCRADYNYKVADILANWLQSEEIRLRFLEKHTDIYESFPRWKNVEGVCNFRDVGGWKTMNPTWSNGKRVKHGQIFRCAAIDGLTLKGQKAIKELGITKIFDFRSKFEIEEHQFELLGDVEFISLAAPEIDEAGLDMYLELAKSWTNFKQVYEILLENVIPLYKPIFEHLRDSQEPVLYHCKAGKDRTGVLTAVILKLLGVPDEIIAREYELTSEGIKPGADKLKEFVTPMLDRLGIPGDEAFVNLMASKYEVMLEVLCLLDSKYGSIDMYLKTKLALTKQDIDTIRGNLLF